MKRPLLATGALLLALVCMLPVQAATEEAEADEIVEKVDPICGNPFWDYGAFPYTPRRMWC